MASRMAHHKNASSPKKAPIEPEDLERIWQKFCRLKEIHDEFGNCLSAGPSAPSSLSAYVRHDQDIFSSVEAELSKLAELAAAARAGSKAELTYKAKIAVAMAQVQNQTELEILMASLVDDLRSS